VVKSNDKKRARVEAMRHVLAQFDYDNRDHELKRRRGAVRHGHPLGGR
jgi:hypothetical protein